MSPDGDGYFARHAANERALAAAATDARVAEIHAELATRYEALHQARADERPKLTIVPAEQASQVA